MAATVKVMAGQSLLDITIQTTGEISNLMAVAAANSVSATALLEAGQLIVIPDGLTMRPNVLKILGGNFSKPSSEYLAETPPATLQDFDLTDFSKEDFY